jgi:tetratricopeptide (TPR) repeat protein
MKLRFPRSPRGGAAFFSPLLAAGFLAASAALAPLCPAAPAPGEQEQFLTLLAAVSDDPDNAPARMELIRFAANMKVKPQLPREAKKFYIKAMAVHVDAANDADFDKAARLYAQAIQVAPWWPQCYYNRAAALEAAKRFDEAEEDKRFYQAARGGPPPKAAPPPKVTTRSGPSDYSGNWGSGLDCWRYEFRISGDDLTIIMHCWDFPRAVYGTGKVTGRTFQGSSPGGQSGTGVGTRSPIRFKGSINEDNTEVEIYSILAPELAETEAAMNSAREQVRLYGTPEWNKQNWRHMARD